MDIYISRVLVKPISPVFDDVTFMYQLMYTVPGTNYTADLKNNTNRPVIIDRQVTQRY